MDQVLESKPLGNSDRADRRIPLVFLDTSVIIGYLRGESSALNLFSAEADGRIHFAVNSIVLQELLLVADAAARPGLERVSDHFKVLPVDFAKAEALIPRARALRNRLAHANDVLILSSARECDFLVSSDDRWKGLVTAEGPEFVTAEELVARLRAT